ncbi:hypothetical protein EYF80_040466 [Liparis tanakae]|uniref:Uncharacterized protein n=1 Tax=Liparis tanakae TaxID=230148 RepID=A0A4Z2G7U6_9TELE|nr:hypothetical protein EYF80_040466 [Liparis tanakae]
MYRGSSIFFSSVSFSGGSSSSFSRGSSPFSLSARCASSRSFSSSRERRKAALTTSSPSPTRKAFLKRLYNMAALSMTARLAL